MYVREYFYASSPLRVRVRLTLSTYRGLLKGSLTLLRPTTLRQKNKTMLSTVTVSARNTVVLGYHVCSVASYCVILSSLFVALLSPAGIVLLTSQDEDVPTNMPPMSSRWCRRCFELPEVSQLSQVWSHPYPRGGEWAAELSDFPLTHEPEDELSINIIIITLHMPSKAFVIAQSDQQSYALVPINIPYS